MPLVACECKGTGSCKYLCCKGRKFEMPHDVPTWGGEVVHKPEDKLYAIEHSKRLLAVERDGKIIGYITVRSALYGPADENLRFPNEPKDARGSFTGVDDFKGARRLGHTWPRFVEQKG